MIIKSIIVCIVLFWKLTPFCFAQDGPRHTSQLSAMSCYPIMIEEWRGEVENVAIETAWSATYCHILVVNVASHPGIYGNDYLHSRKKNAKVFILQIFRQIPGQCKKTVQYVLCITVCTVGQKVKHARALLAHVPLDCTREMYSNQYCSYSTVW